MLITLTTKANCIESDKARSALEDFGIAFTERKEADPPPASVLLVARINDDVVAWTGYRPDMTDLLADLLDMGPVPEGGIDDLENAEEAVLTRTQVVAEIHNHQQSTKAFFEECGDHPLYRGSVLLNWLGY